MSEEPINVAVIAGDEVTRRGLAALLMDDPRVRPMDPVAGVDALREADAHFDVCVLEYDETRVAEIELLATDEVPVVVWAKTAQWRPLVAAWVWGARVVVGAGLGRGSLIDAALDAVHRPFILKPQLAGALGDAVSECGLEVPTYLLDLLWDVRKGRPVTQLIKVLGLDETDFLRVLGELRDECRNAGLGHLGQVTGWGGAGRAALEPGNVPPEALNFASRTRATLEHYADGLDYDAVAHAMSISPYTVRNSINAALEKFGIRHGRGADVRLLFAVWLSGRHRYPDRVRRRLIELRDADEPLSEVG